jgi:hypothetical protein
MDISYITAEIVPILSDILQAAAPVRYSGPPPGEGWLRQL